MHEKPQQLVKKPTVLDLFCGAGGISLGFQNAGCEILGGIDKNPHAIRTHQKKFPDCKLKLPARDIHDVNLYELPLQPGEVNILISGPPCQVFSVVGRVKIKSLSQSDIDSDRIFCINTL
ncbi:MAG: DNA cytosine methyltransferase [Hormoscilla sp. SP5CHS1]|nr:DNA cytosine methyltransferase [Hormoscilla sp. SP5CHS1]